MTKSLRGKNDRFPHDGPLIKRRASETQKVSKPQTRPSLPRNGARREQEHGSGAPPTQGLPQGQARRPLWGSTSHSPSPSWGAAGWGSRSRPGSPGTAAATGEDRAFEEEPQVSAAADPSSTSPASGKFVRAEGRPRRLGTGFHKVQYLGRKQQRKETRRWTRRKRH